MEPEAAPMDAKQESLILAGMCLVVILLCLGGLAWAVVSGQLLTLDGILLVLTCLLIGGIFTLMLGLLAHSQGWLPKFGRRSAAAPPDSANPPPGPVAK